jgi:hypothetical protein
MKHLLLALMLAIGFDTSAQVDGMFAFSLDSSQDTVYSMYNASPDIRDELKDHLLEMFHGYELTDGAWIIDLPNSNSKILGDLFLTETQTCVLFDFYVDEVKFSDGTTYQAERFAKPLRTLNKY